MTQLSIPAVVEPDVLEDARRQSVRRRWIFPVSIVLAAVLLFLSLRGVEWRRAWSIVSGCRISYLLAGASFGVIAYLIRALRWRLLLTPGEKLGFRTVLWASSAGYLGNSFLPARAGELVRTAMIASRSQLSRAYVLTTAVSERVLDVVILVLMASCLALSLEHRPAWLTGISVAAAATAFSGASFLSFLPQIDGAVRRVILKLPLSHHLRERLGRMTEGGAAAMHVFRRPALVIQFGLFTVLIWLLDASGAVVLARALGMHLSLTVALILLTGLAVGSALPSTPGAIGILQFVAVTVLVPFNFTHTDAIAFILVAQAAGYVTIAALGVIGIWRYNCARGCGSN